MMKVIVDSAVGDARIDTLAKEDSIPRAVAHS
jgi:hypothetical protein